MFVSLDKVDAELPQRGGGGVTECKRYSSLHRLDVGRGGGAARQRARHAAAKGLVRDQSAIERHVAPLVLIRRINPARG